MPLTFNLSLYKCAQEQTSHKSNTASVQISQNIQPTDNRSENYLVSENNTILQNYHYVNSPHFFMDTWNLI